MRKWRNITVKETITFYEYYKFNGVFSYKVKYFNEFRTLDDRWFIVSKLSSYLSKHEY